MKRIISIICIFAMLMSLSPVFAAENDDNFTDEFNCTIEDFLNPKSANYVSARKAITADTVEIRSIGGTIGYGLYRSDRFPDEEAYVTYKVRPESKIVAEVYDSVGNYNISFAYSRDNKTYSDIYSKPTLDGKYTDSENNEYTRLVYTLIMPADAEYLTIYLPEAITKEEAQGTFYANGGIGIVKVSMSDSEREQHLEANIYWNDVHQLIEGFGGSLNTDGTHHIKHHPELLDLMYDPENGMGFSIVRAPMPTEPRADGEGPIKKEGQPLDFSKDASQVWAMKRIKELNPDTTILACSWTPMTYMKDNKQISGGKLLPEYYQEYAEFFADFIEGYQREHGLKIDILSPQNEPELAPAWGSCIWTGEDFNKFVKENLAPEFKKRNIDTEIMIGDYANFKFPEGKFAFLDDEETRDEVDLISAHSYWSLCDRFDYGKELNKRLWQTETSDVSTKDDPSIEYGLGWARQVHVLLTKPEVNAFLYWYLVHQYYTNESLITCLDDDGYVINKRCWTFANYSKFIRPGYYRIGADESPTADALISAYKDEESGKCVAVCINDSTEEMTFDYKLNGFTAENVTAWRTSGDEDLAKLDTKAVNGSLVTLTLAPRSITSFIFDGCQSEIVDGMLEAETNSAKLGNAQNSESKNFRGNMGVKYVGAKDNGVRFDHLASSNSFSVRYSSLGADMIQYDLYVNDTFVKTVDFPSTLLVGVATGDVYVDVNIPEDGNIKLLAKSDSDGIFIDNISLNPNMGELSIVSETITPNFDWAQSYVANVSDYEIMDISQENAGEFITRALYVKALVNLLGLKSEWAVNFFDAFDTKDYYNEVGIARELGVIPQNDDNLFYPDEPLTREDMFIMTANALKLKDYTKKGEVSPSEFEDWSALSEEGREAAELLISNGIISGSGARLNPKGYTYYAQVAVVFSSLMN